MFLGLHLLPFHLIWNTSFRWVLRRQERWCRWAVWHWVTGVCVCVMSAQLKLSLKDQITAWCWESVRCESTFPSKQNSERDWFSFSTSLQWSWVKFLNKNTTIHSRSSKPTWKCLWYSRLSLRHLKTPIWTNQFLMPLLWTFKRVRGSFLIGIFHLINVYVYKVSPLWNEC